ncbi:MAG TPA: hypothetical protein VFC45_09910 [Pseudolabrys sp.]|nr:hypothetical protein [Pseudolabrys sp.]
MAEKRTTPEAPQNAQEDASPGARRNKRAAPTIDLTASEVPPSQPDTPPSPGQKSGQEPPQAAPEPPPAEAAKTSRGFSFSMATLAAGAAGAVVMTVILAGLWLTGLVPVRYVATTSATDTIDSKSLDALTQRVTAADNALKVLGIALTALNRRTDDAAANASQARERADGAAKAVAELQASVQETAKSNAAGMSPAEHDALQKRLVALEQSAKAAHDDIAKTTTADSAARLALSAAALRDAVLSGAPFAAELAQAKSLGADDNVLAPLAPFAASGIPAPQALEGELRTLLPAMLKISGAQAPQGGFIERLEANAGRLVRIRPVDAPPGDDAAAVLARLEIDAAKADIAAALADLGKLPDATRAPAQAWIVKANERQTALAAARQYAADAARAFGAKAGVP